LQVRSVARAAKQLPRDAVKAVRGRPTSPDTYLVVRRLNVRTGGRFAVGLASTMRHLPGAADVIDRATHTQLLHIWADEVNALDTDGVCRVPDAFQPDELAALVDFATNGPASLLRADGTTVPGTYAQRGHDVVSVRVDQSFLLAHPAIQAMMARAMAADIATARNGLWSTIHPPVLYWTCRSQARAGEQLSEQLAQRFHSDFDGLGGLRLHVYLTDVDEGAAPMDYVRASHLPGALPGSIRRDTLAPIAIDEVIRRFGASAIHTVTGPAGTSFMSDSNGLHRGNPAVSADRLFLVMPVQAGSIAGAYNRIRRLPVVDSDLGRALQSGRRDLRLFEAAPTGSQRVATLVV
jgi:hypothetical protein